MTRQLTPIALALMGTEHQTTVEEDEIGENQSKGDKENMTIREEQKQV
jgi:hypothetical protein